jgi:hypothetical protein
VLIGIVAGLSGVLASPAHAALVPGTRVTVGLFGDSVTEGIVIPDFQRRGLAADLARDETHYGFSAGGQGLIAVNQYQWRFSSYAIVGQAAVPPAGWGLVGSQSGDIVTPGTDGPSGYSAVSVSATATATTTVRDPDVEILYTTSILPCDFSVSSGSRSWTISTGLPGAIEPEAAQYGISLGPGRHQLVVHGSSCGVVFDGVVAQDPVAPGTTQIQVDNDGHAARAPATDLAPRVEQAIVAQHDQVTVLLYGYIGELAISPGRAARAYAAGLLTRARLARMNGGSCLIVHPTPIQGATAARIALVTAVERSVARQAGCTYSTALADLWNRNTSIAQGLTVLDGIHPTAQGYVLMARALAPIVARLARASIAPDSLRA